MLAGVLHDLKTPMTIISGYAQLMAASRRRRRSANRYVELILRQFDLMPAMTREVLAFARGESELLVRKVYVQKWSPRCARSSSASSPARGSSSSSTTRYDGVAYFDEQKMFRVIHNLARNAARRCPSGGTFTHHRRHRRAELAWPSPTPARASPTRCAAALFELFATRASGAAPASASRSSRRSSTITAGASAARAERGVGHDVPRGAAAGEAGASS